MKKQDQTHLIKILVIAPDSVSDQAMSYPFFHYLRELYPSAQITVICNPVTEHLQYRHLVDQVVVWSPLKRGSALQMLREWDQIRVHLKDQGSWELGFDLSFCFSSVWTLYRAGVMRRRGYGGRGRGLLLNERRSLDLKTVLHRAEEFVALLPGYEKKLPPVLSFWGHEGKVSSLDSAEEERSWRGEGVVDRLEVESAWPEVIPLDPLTHPYGVFAPDAQAPSRQWPEVYFESLAVSFLEETSFSLLILSARTESAWVIRLRERFKHRVVFVEVQRSQSFLAACWKIFRHSQFSLCNDSEFAHLSTLCGARTFVVWGAGRIAKTQPLGSGQVQIHVHPVECWPCDQKFCDQPDALQFQCLTSLRPEVIFDAIMKEIEFRAKS